MRVRARDLSDEFGGIGEIAAKFGLAEELRRDNKEKGLWLYRETNSKHPFNTSIQSGWGFRQWKMESDILSMGV